MISGDSIAGRLSALRHSVAEAARRSGRGPEDIRIVLVTKTVPALRIQEAIDEGARDFGENRVQELLEKKQGLSSGLRWHMIGHLQTNKVRQLAGQTELIHSLDRPELAREIDRQARQKGLPQQDCLIQVNISGEDTKFGLAPEAVDGFAASLSGLHLRVRGLMTIGPLTEDESRIRACFRAMKKLQDDMKKKYPREDWSILSMGMSGDYEAAIEEGSTLVRIGTAVFGKRT